MPREPREYSQTPLGRRLAEFRIRRRFSAAGLAKKIDDPTITRAVITNIETGRKADPPLSEVMKICDALGISPLALMIDTSSPWAPLDTPGLSTGRLREVSAIEYARAATLYGPSGFRNGGFSSDLSSFLEALIESEVQVERAKFISNLLMGGEPLDQEASYSGETEAYEPWSVSAPDVSEEGLEEAQETVVAAYRTALAAREQDARWPGQMSKLSRLSPRFERRLDEVRRVVVNIIAANAEIDYGQDGRRSLRGRFATPPLDPKTGLAIRPAIGELDG
ncbi:hypothetical protein GCM10025867_39900 [Frondihabitans sucicola]|uniref:HTH cro/C1-type domain-containing protein n=1 Tax=Frondihabitans sucicola TaxID=1268041 RepID=A0ABM8GTF0_9MICO|nr:helix-turn-helix transcriptional regulator [Frondihabitans sucicola]BDZ51749.1 hypothetical protein GCM10025867_39900 [Frondihabitans sucicola]